jgi:chemosensory pili system protein ChpA (sensor histidine kinase/response regulator)
MSAQQTSDFTTLRWIKQELDDTLQQALHALQTYVEDPSDSSQIQLCANNLHQVQGTLRMVELYGAAMVAEEMERLAQDLLSGQVSPQEDTYSVLMRGIVQLPDYLERLQSGHKDIPIVLLPLLNDLRACRGQKLLSESALFAPNLDAALPVSAGGAAQLVGPLELRAQAGNLRTAYLAALLKWFRDDAAAGPLDRLLSILDRLRGLCVSVESRRLWWVAAGVIEGVQSHSIEPSVTLKLLFGKIDREIRRLQEDGEIALRSDPTRELVKNLLYYVAHARDPGPRSTELRATYKLNSLLPSDQELRHAKGSVSGHNRTLLDTVAVAIRDDLLRVKESLDIFLRSHSREPGQLQAQAEVLDRVGDTLGMLGLGIPRRLVGEQRQALADIAAGVRVVEESSLLDIAGTLIYVESSLDDHIERLGATEENAEPAGFLEHLPTTEVRRILDALMQEAATNLAQAKQEIISFIEAPWMHSHMTQIPHRLEEVSGALIMLDLVEPAHFMTAIQRFVEVELLQHKRVPTAAQLDRLADAFASMEYYLEATRERRSGREEILNAARSSLTALGYWPIPQREPISWTGTLEASAAEHAESIPEHRAAAEFVPEVGLAAPAPLLELPVETQSAVPQMVAVIETQTSGAVESESVASTVAAPGHEAITDAEDDYIEIEEEIEEEVPEYDFSPVTTHFESVTTNEIDADIRGVFLEEVGEEIENLHTTVAAWRVNPHDLPKLIPIRRSFHTLKGSGRLVGAAAIGEFGWKMENLLNRVLDRTVQPNVDVEALITRAIDALPGLLAALSGAGEVDADLGEIVYHADRLIAGGEINALENPQLRMRMIKRVVRRRVLRSSLAPVPTIAAVAESSEPAILSSDTLLQTESRGTSWSGIDPVLFDILRTEVAAHLNVVDTHLDAAAGNSIPVTEDLVRALHTLNGAIATVEIPVLGGVLSPLEAYVKGVYSRNGVLDSTGAQVLANTSTLIKQVMLELESDHPQWPSSMLLAEQVNSLRGSAPDSILPYNVRAAEFEAYKDDTIAQHPADSPDAGVTDDSDVETSGHMSIDAAIEAAIEEAINQKNAHTAYVDNVTLHDEEISLSSDEPIGTAGDESAEHTFLVSDDDNDFFKLHDEPLHVVGAVTPEQRKDDAEDLYTSGLVFERFSHVETPSVEVLHEAAATDSSMTEATLSEPLLGDAVADELLFSMFAESPKDDSQQPAARETHIDEQVLFTDQPGIASVDGSADEEIILSNPYPAPTDAAHHYELSQSTTTTAATAAQPITETIVEQRAEDEHGPNVLLLDETPAPAIADDVQPDGVLAAVDIDDDLLEVFVQEGADILDHADALLTRLHRAPQDKEILSGLQRELHTLKGGARMANLEPIGDLSHVMESMLEAISEQRRPMTRAAMDSFERGFDRLHTLIQRVSQRQAIGMPVNAIARFEALVAGTSLQAPHAAAVLQELTREGERGVQVDTTPAQTVPTIAAVTPSRPRLVVRADEEEIAPRATQEMIRVRADTLDTLVNFAGEVSIYRSRLEQQVGNFRSNLVELEQTVSRLRDQLRSLEMETEAQILSRFQREHVSAAEGGFDPLEMDRYSQLQQTSRALAESVSDLVSIQNLLDDQARQSETLLLQQSRVSSELQEGLMRTRMVPFESMVPSLRRILRQTAEETGKRAQLNVRGAQGEMDRNLLDRMKAPFEHMLRNALAHGIETPEEREAAGKQGSGSVDIAVSREATEVLIRVSDDGRGLDRVAIRQRAIERGLLAADARPNDSELFNFILQTGFSTASQITQVAGRGVGMDVVNNEIKQLGGSLAIQSTPGQGSSFSIRLPFTLAVAQAILVRIGDVSYAIPMSAVQGVARIESKDFEARLVHPDPVYAYLGESFLLCELPHLLDISGHRPVEESQYPLLLTRAGEQRAAIRIDAVIGSREIVVKSVGPQISSVPGIFGATIMGDGSVVMILDLATLLRRHAARRELALSEPESVVQPPQQIAPVAPIRTIPLIMVVDDSITMRKVTSRVLERSEMGVITAKDGLDAIDKMQDQVPDLMLLDIEMPRMDGFELATHMRNDPRLRGVPIIMITSRSGDKHRQRALEIGVDRYLGKPYQEADLLLNIREVLGATRGV